MFKLSALFLAVATLLVGCGYDGHYRYPCQDPENWQNAECNPPVCKATGTCTEDLVPLEDEAATDGATDG